MTARYHPRARTGNASADPRTVGIARAWTARAGAGDPAALAAVLDRVRETYRVPASRVADVLPPATPAVAGFCARWKLSPALVWTLLVDAAKLDLGFGVSFRGQGRPRTRGPLSFENEPGYLRAMLAAFAGMLDSLDRPLTAAGYRRLHDDAVAGVRHPDGTPFETGFARRPWRCGFMWNIEGQLPMFPTISREAWAELLGERIVFVPRPTYLDRDLRALIPPGVGPSRCLVRLTWQPTQLRYCLAPTLRAQSVAVLRRVLPRRVQALLARGRRAMSLAAALPVPAERRAAELAAIVRLCRDLELSHFFPDGNARTACTLVLHKLLLAQGYGPVVLEAPYVMDGYFSTPEMVACLERGFDHVRRVRAAFGDDA
ncbi:MAG: hypothetical protein U0325_00660 [Polyangiales bacterium]